MGWRDDLRPASFRGVPFVVRTSDVQEGRRWVVHEFPSRAKPFSEDLGPEPGRYTFEAYVLGDDYFEKRDALREACQDESPGELVHPYLGSISVVCRGIRIREETNQGRMARVQLEFTESGEELIASLDDLTGLAEDAANAATEASESVLETVLTMLGLPDWVVDGALTTMETVQTILDGVETLEGALEDVSDFVEEVATILDPFVDLTEAPFRIARAISNTIAKAEAAIGSRTAAAEVYLDWARAQFGDGPRDSGSAADDINQANIAAIQSHFGIAAAAQAVRVASEVSWESFDDARQYQLELQAALDELAANATDDDVYREVTGLQSVLARVVPPETEQLPRIQVVTPVNTVPSLVLAYRLYGDARRWETDIVRRNRPSHPAFLVGGQPVEVLVS